MSGKYQIKKIFPLRGGFWDRASRRYFYWRVTEPNGEPWDWGSFEDAVACFDWLLEGRKKS